MHEQSTSDADALEARRAKRRASKRDYQRRYYAKNRDKILAWSARWNDAHPGVKMQAARRWEARNPERAKMSRKATIYVRDRLKSGKLVRPDTCENCGTTGVKITAAHSDYSQPLLIRWLCWPCHRRWDVASPKTR